MAAAQVVCGSRLARLVNELPQPSVQLPQVVFFMGRHPKNKTLRQLCSSNYRGQCRSQPGVNIRSDNRTLQALQPRFFADCDPCRSLLSTHQSLRNCHEEKIYSLELPCTEHSLQDIIISRLIFLFTDVVCTFADDVGGFEGTRRLLTTWAAIGSASSLPPAVRPRVIVVVSQSPSATGSVIDEDDFLFELLHAGDVPYFSAFRDIQVSSLPAEEHLSQFFEHMASNLGRSSEIHKNNLEQQRKFWTWAKSNKPVSCVLDATLNTLRHVDMAYATAAWRSLASRPFMLNMNTLFFSASSAGTQKV
ncbi:hypothetical protein CBS76997_11266 [Aspergillus niger]|uniref:Uncharacterized protein n=1 Tax=Aspergillus niger TaxID=5061 RepID=A0A9W6EGX3_ASPNG|nr:hypothetical protein CBS13152_11206 [Aspergillus niger]KAI2869848.1 hypothetical protein CBS11852_11173 [Aspergillus niger]KAI2948627.1 hypothetical protein CBS147323_11054 [Aspergillus niger]KAI3033775.1 hypothetical protein CBS76997_11266 [Aspergillus niger]KAI3055628.1 hypothetical protein CBS147353_11302 [Aspergillus niger]